MLQRSRLRRVREREGRYLLRTNIGTAQPPEALWRFYIQLTEVEQAASGVEAGLVRLSVGIESIDDIIADLDQAFAAAK